MNLYIHLEIISRELDAKILLAIVAASKGHDVFLSDVENIEKNIKRGFLMPGIFHTKSITPDKPKMERHQAMIDKKCKITSMDEEGGLVNAEFENFARRRFSDESIKMSSALFFWGQYDYENIKSIYPNHSSKIFKTGSPRVDLWRQRFFKYWQLPSNAPTKPYLLFVSNNGGPNGYLRFFERVKNQRDWDYFTRDPESMKEFFYRGSDQFKLTYKFIEAIKFLSENNTDIDIVLRPHPTENLKSWITYLDGIPNVYINRDGPISNWVRHSLAIVHNACTTGIEAIISNKPLISYIAINRHNNFFTNELGYIIKNKEDLLVKVNELLDNRTSSNQENLKDTFFDDISHKISIDQNELAAEKIVKVWESLSDQYLSKQNNWKTLKLILKMMEINGKINRKTKKLFFGDKYKAKINYKFPPFNKIDILNRFNKLKNILKIDREIECEILSKRAILIRPIKKQ